MNGFRKAVGLVSAVFVLVALWLAWAYVRSPLDPVLLAPPPAPALTGPYAPNEALRSAVLYETGGRGPEDVDEDAEGRLYTGLEDGRIVRLTPREGATPEVETFARTGGRPLGLAFAPDGELIVADAAKGLLSVSPDGTVRVLVEGGAGAPVRVADDVDVARDGTVYFTDAMSRWDLPDYMLDALEGRPTGRLLRYDPQTRALEVLLDGLHFANGVALSANEDFVLVNETWMYRVTRYWLAGERAGRSDVFFDNAPGFPDGIASDRAGRFYLALPTLRNPQADSLAPYPALRRLVAGLPRALWPKPERYGFILVLDESGAVVEGLHDPGGARVFMVTSVQPSRGHLLLGSLHAGAVGRLQLQK